MIIVFSSRDLFNRLVISPRTTLDGVDLSQDGFYQPCTGADGRCLMDFPVSVDALADLKTKWAGHGVRFLDALPGDWQCPKETT